MDKWCLLIGLAVLLLLTWILFIYPLQSEFKKRAMIISPVLLLMTVVLYNYLGSWKAWIIYEDKQAKTKQIRELLANKSQDDIINSLKERLDDTPKSAQGWYLLGRLYMSQANWLKARDAFATSKQLNPKDVKNSINYIISLWQINNQHGDETIRQLLVSLLKDNPTQPDALALLAMDAYDTKDFLSAIGYWQQLLKQVPEYSEEAKALRKAIAKAEKISR